MSEIEDSTSVGSVVDIVEAEASSQSVDNVTVTELVEVEAEVTEWTLCSDAIVIKRYSTIPQWLEDIINDAVDWTEVNDDIEDLQNMLDLLGAGYTDLVAITDDHAVRLTYLASQQDGMAASIQHLEITKITETEAIAISKETIGAWLEGGEAAAWFDRMIQTNASLTSANAVAISNLHTELDGIESEVGFLSEASVTKTNNSLWWNSCIYDDPTHPDYEVPVDGNIPTHPQHPCIDPNDPYYDPNCRPPEVGCEPKEYDLFGNPRWIYDAHALAQLRVDANGNVSGFEASANSNKSQFKIYADSFFVTSSEIGTIATAPFVINTNIAPPTIHFNGSVSFVDPLDPDSNYGTIIELENLAQQAKNIGSMASEQATEMAADNIINGNEKGQFRNFRTKTEEEYARAIARYALFNLTPGGTSPDPALDPHQAALNSYDSAYNALLVYLDGMNLSDDTSDYVIPDRSIWDSTFNNFFNTRNVAIDYLLDAFVQDLGLDNGGTIIDGGHLQTGLITSTGSEGDAFWNLETGQFKTEANVGTTEEFILDSTASGNFVAPGDPNNHPNIKGGLIEGSQIAGSTIDVSTDITSPTLLVGHIKVQGQDYDGSGNLFTGVPAHTLHAAEELLEFIGWNSTVGNVHDKRRICNSESHILVQAKLDTDIQADEGASASVEIYLDLSTDAGVNWQNIQFAKRREDPNSNNDVNSKLPVHLISVVYAGGFTGLEQVRFKLRWTFEDGDASASDPEIVATVYNA